MLHTNLIYGERSRKASYGMSVRWDVNKYGSRYMLSLCLSSSRHRSVILASGHAMPIYDIRVLRRWVSFGILRSETLPKRGDHLREPVYFQSSFSCSAKHSCTGGRRKRNEERKEKKEIDLTRTRSAR
jgi:hypothetical protein